VYRIGLTGGIAAGKSTVLQWLMQQGAPTVDADLVARQVVEPGAAGLAAVTKAFGTEILLPNGALNRSVLGDIVFNDEVKRMQLNEILHSFIRAEMDCQARQFEAEGATAVIFDIPLLIETGWHETMDEVWLVYVDRNTQIERLMKRNQYSREEALSRINSQMPLVDKKVYSDEIIDNSGTEEDLARVLRELWNRKGRLFNR